MINAPALARGVDQRHAAAQAQDAADRVLVRRRGVDQARWPQQPVVRRRRDAVVVDVDAGDV
jgi:hypothetical protein